MTFCDVAVLVDQGLSGLVDPGRRVSGRCPDIISFAFLQKPVPAFPLGPPDASPEVASRLFEAADAGWAVSPFPSGFS
jgi:hypothetical protein